MAHCEQLNLTFLFCRLPGLALWTATTGEYYRCVRSGIDAACEVFKVVHCGMDLEPPVVALTPNSRYFRGPVGNSSLKLLY